MATEPEVRRYLRRLRVRRRLEGPPLDMRPRITVPTTLQKIFKQRNQKRSSYYLTTGRVIPDEDKEEHLEDGQHWPFWTPPAEHFVSFAAHHKMLVKRHREKDSALPAQLKPTARSRQAAGLLRRLHIPDEQGPQEKTIVDMDPEFYSIVEGRPNRDRVGIREYIDHIRQLVRVRLKIGYNEDECILVDEQFRSEKQRYDKIMEKHKQYVEVFEQFLADDHAASMELLKKADLAGRLSAEKDAQIKLCIRNLGLARTQVYMMEERWRAARQLQRFLYLVSPMPWRREHDHINGAILVDGSTDSLDRAIEGPPPEQEGSQDPETAPSSQDIADSEGKRPAPDDSLPSQTSLQRTNSLDRIIDDFLEETRDGHEPLLYFEEPEQLIKVFRTLAAQSLASLMHIEQLRLPLEALQAGVEQAKQKVAAELQELEEQVRYLEREIEWEERRIVDFRKTADAVLGSIYDDIMEGHHNVLMLRVCVEDVYERCVAPNDSRLALFALMKGVENQVTLELDALDYLDREQVKRARKQICLEEKRHTKMAQDAQRKLQQMEQLVYRMERALEPPPQHGRRRQVYRSQPPEVKKPPTPPPPALTEDEKDIAFFSDIKPADRLRIFLPTATYTLAGFERND